MRVSRQTATELVVEDSCLWIAWFLATVSLCLFCAGAFVGDRTGACLVGTLFLLFALGFTRRSRFVFDARERVVRWSNLLFLRNSTGSLAFDDIRGIGIEAFSSEGNSYTYRLTILTSAKPVPLSSAYGPGEEKYAKLRQTIATFVSLETGSLESAVDVDPSVLELVRARRKIDAIALLRSMREMSLLDAKRIVDELERRAKVKF